MNGLYKDYSDFLAEHFDGKIQKLSVDVGFTCPNRDGSSGTGGCIYCNNLAFSPDWQKRRLPVSEQLERGRRFFARKYPSMRYLAYFQSYTGTYAPIDELMKLYSEALAEPDIVGIIIGTRPDCMPDQLLEQLKQLPGKVFIEFGAESSHDKTLELVNRCHTWECTVDAVKRTAASGFPVGLHFILGLPGETEDMMVETVVRAGRLPISTVKFHQLQILRGTRLAQIAGRLDIPSYSAGQYAALCARLLKHLRPDIAVERFVAQAPADMLLSPKWGLKNYQFTALLRKYMEKEN